MSQLKNKNLPKKVYKVRLKKNDTVVVISGKYKGKTGKVTAVHPSLNKVTVEGVNVAKRHVKPSKANPQGAILDVIKPIWVSKVAIVEPSSKKPSRIGYKLDAKGTKTRIFKRTGKEIPSNALAKKDKK